MLYKKSIYSYYLLANLYTIRNNRLSRQKFYHNQIVSHMLRLRTLKHDFPAWLSVFLVAIPLCLGISIASWAPLMSGLIAGIVWGIVVGAISNSSLSVSWPAAGLVAIVVSAIASLGFTDFLLALVIAGALQVVLWLVKASKIVKYVPTSVIKGMLAAIGMTLIIKQLPVMIGRDIRNFVRSAPNLSYNVLIIWIMSLLVIVGWNTYAPKKIKVIPGSIVAVLIGIVVSLIYSQFMPEWSLITQQLVQLPTNLGSLQSIWASSSHP